jgi:hypothetical protein
MASAGFQFEVAEDRRTLQAPGARLAFHWLGDRWTHTIEVGSLSAPGWLRVACAIEGDVRRDDSASAVSPVYQAIEPHAFELGARVLLTGQAGRHHFSAVVTARSERACSVLEFDVADRCRSPVHSLACTYEIPIGSTELIDAGPRRIEWGGGELGAGRLELAAELPAHLTLAASSPRSCHTQVLAHVDPDSFTNRCVYHFVWTPAENGAERG